MVVKWLGIIGVVAAFGCATAQPSASPVDDLPLIEAPAGDGTDGTLFAVLFSGDGGWASLDEDLTTALAEDGVPVVGVNSLRYFWRERTPDEVAADLGRLLEHYAALWRKSRAIVIGYSQGADVVPFALNRLDPAVRARVERAVLIAPSAKATFEFHIVGWLGKDTGDTPTTPEIARLDLPSVLCLYGADDSKTVCPSLALPHVRSEELPGGHHFDGDYAALAARVLAGLTSSADP
jgi:type IV secretory pathway VirJ component